MQLNALKKGGINILKEYLKVLKSVETEKKHNNLFVLEVVKLNYELELKCYKQAINTFSKILKMQDPVAAPWPLLVRAAFLLGKIEELYKSYILWGVDIDKLDLKNSYNKLFASKEMTSSHLLPPRWTRIYQRQSQLLCSRKDANGV